MSKLKLQIPEKMEPFLYPKRFKVAKGGRGGTKSWTVADLFLIGGIKEKQRYLCARELQSSIKQSVHKLLSDRIAHHKLESHYKVLDATIKGINGTEFFFEGLKHNADKIKSYEGIDKVWLEEAHKISTNSLDYLIPTIRKDNSEIWITFNPELEEDAVYDRFITNQPDNCVVVDINWRDNPWFPEVLRLEMEDCKKRDPDGWLNIWEGQCLKVIKGSIYTNELRLAYAEKRITKVPYMPQAPVHTFWDLGHSDATAIWFMQRIGFENHFIDFYQNNQQWLPHYIEVLNQKGYVYGTDYLPHDGRSNTLGAASIQLQMKDFNRTTKVVPRTVSIEADIQKTRAAFANCYFDETKCFDGLNSLRRYKYDVDVDGRVSRKPRHDQHSNPADAFRTYGVGFRELIVSKQTQPTSSRAGGLGFMGG